MLAEELDDVPRELGALVDLRRARRNPLTREIANQVTDLALLVSQRIAGHGWSLVPPSRTAARGIGRH